MTVDVILSKEAKLRLRWMTYYQKYRNARLTCRHFGISPDTFYHWKKKFSPAQPQSLEDDLRNRRPARMKSPIWTKRHLMLVQKVKQKYPYMGRIGLYKILRERGWTMSASTIGRMLRAVRG